MSLRDGERYVDPDGKVRLYNEEQHEAAKEELLRIQEQKFVDFLLWDDEANNRKDNP